MRQMSPAHQTPMIYEFIGRAFILLMSCIGIYTLSKLIIEGIHRTAGRIEIGKVYEDAAVRDRLLEVDRFK
jgi:hypothetical protein